MVLHMTDAEYIEKLEGTERRLNRDKKALLEACEAFVKAWEKSHQLEKTDVAMRKARIAIALAKETTP
ncbi:hypothetical protein LCGC14_0235680 [marine sediment metagenome]|uniref:Uncharacterized protein n=1 Tax=marine sediment metagenome TaxID=412755 RepID=A0A0F9UQB8_9ZZZZ